jgi:hypothetical protein
VPTETDQHFIGVRDNPGQRKCRVEHRIDDDRRPAPMSVGDAGAGALPCRIRRLNRQVGDPRRYGRHHGFESSQDSAVSVTASRSDGETAAGWDLLVAGKG